MGDHDGGLAQLVGLVGQQAGHVPGPTGVQGGGGLVGQDDVGVVVEGHGDGGALALPARQVRGVGAGAPGDAQILQEAVAPAGVGPGAGRGVVEGELVVEPEEGDQPRGLEDEADAAQAQVGPAPLGQRGEGLARDGHGPGRGAAQAAHDGQERGLARAGGAQDPHQLAAAELEVGAAQRVDGLAALPVVPGHALQSHRRGPGLPGAHETASTGSMRATARTEMRPPATDTATKAIAMRA